MYGMMQHMGLTAIPEHITPPNTLTRLLVNAISFPFYFFLNRKFVSVVCSLLMKSLVRI